MSVALFLVSLGSNVLGGRDLAVSVAYALANTAEALTVTVLVLRAGGPRAVLASMSGLFHLVRACAAGAAVIALGVGLTVWLLEDGQGWDAARAVAASH